MPHLQDPASALYLPCGHLSVLKPYAGHFLTKNGSLLPSGWCSDTARLPRPTASCWCTWLYLSHKHSSSTSLQIYWALIMCWILCWELYIHDSPIPHIPPVGLPLLWPPHGTTSLLSSYESHPQPMAVESNTFTQTLQWTYWVRILTFPLRSGVTLGIFFNLSMPQFPYLCDRSNGSSYLAIIEHGVIVSFDWDNTCEVPSIVSRMPGMTLHALGTCSSSGSVLSQLDSLARSSSLKIIFPASPRPCMTLSGWERGSLHIGLRVSCSYLQCSTYLVEVSVVVSNLCCWIPKGQDPSWVICVPRVCNRTDSWWVLSSGIPGWRRRDASCVSCLTECPVLQPEAWRNLGGLSHLWPPNKFNVGLRAAFVLDPSQAQAVQLHLHTAACDQVKRIVEIKGTENQVSWAIFLTMQQQNYPRSDWQIRSTLHLILMHLASERRNMLNLKLFTLQ